MKPILVEKKLKSGRVYKLIPENLKNDGIYTIEQGNAKVQITKSDLNKLYSLISDVHETIYDVEKQRKIDAFPKTIPKRLEILKNALLKKRPLKKKGLWCIYGPSYEKKILYRVRGTWEEAVEFAFAHNSFIRVNNKHCEVIIGYLQPILEPASMKIVELERGKK